MANVLFTNVRILDGSGEYPYTGEVLVQGNRIKHVGRGSRTVPGNGHTVIDGAGDKNAIEGRTNECDVMHCCMHAFCGPCSTVCIRTKVVEKYTIDEGAVVSCLLALCCGPCSMCQTHRELSQRNVWPGGTVCHKQPTSYDSLK